MVFAMGNSAGGIVAVGENAGEIGVGNTAGG